MSMYRTIPLTPISGVNGLRREIDRFFDDAFQMSGRAGWMPAVEAREEGTGFVFEYDLPGVAPDHLEVITEDGMLIVRGERPQRELSEGERRLISERFGGRFERRMRLPKSADPATVNATYEHGVLTIRVAKVAPAMPRRVEITVGGAPHQVSDGMTGKS